MPCVTTADIAVRTLEPDLLEHLALSSCFVAGDLRAGRRLKEERGRKVLAIFAQRQGLESVRHIRS